MLRGVTSTMADQIKPAVMKGTELPVELQDEVVRRQEDEAGNSHITKLCRSTLKCIITKWGENMERPRHYEDQANLRTLGKKGSC